MPPLFFAKFLKLFSLYPLTAGIGLSRIVAKQPKNFQYVFLYHKEVHYG